jgi:hypothetical protein
MGGNNEKCYSAIPSCDHSFPCFEWLWAKSISHCHPRGAHTDAGAADGNSSTASANNGTTYTDATTANTNGSAAYIEAGIAHANTGAPNTHSDIRNDYRGQRCRLRPWHPAPGAIGCAAR